MNEKTIGTIGRIPTFRTKESGMLSGASARRAWGKQVVRCNCGDHGDAANEIAGTAGDMPARWLGCGTCPGQALGRPLVYRLPSQFQLICG